MATPDTRARPNRPGRGAAVVLGLAVGVTFTLVGLVITVPTFGAAGACWTLGAGGLGALYRILPLFRRGGPGRPLPQGCPPRPPGGTGGGGGPSSGAPEP